MVSRFILPLLIAFLAVATPAQDPSHGPPWANVDLASTHPMHFGEGVLQIDFAKGPLDLPIDTVLEHFHKAGSAIVAYYGRFPIARDRMLIVPVAGRDGVFHGTTWPHHGDYQAFTRIHVGEHITA